MIYFVAFYGILSTLGVLVHLQHGKWVAAFCVALLAGCALVAGRELRAGLLFGKILERLLRCLLSLLPLGVALWLSHYTVPLLSYVVPGIHWVILGFLIGFGHKPTYRR